MKTVSVVLGLSLLASIPAQAAIVPVPDWVVPTMEQAPAHSFEKTILALWVLGFPCPELDNVFAPTDPPILTPPPAPYVPPVYVPPLWSPPGGGPRPTPVPETATWLMLAFGLAGIVTMRRARG